MDGARIHLVCDTSSPEHWHPRASTVFCNGYSSPGLEDFDLLNRSDRALITSSNPMPDPYIYRPTAMTSFKLPWPMS